MFTFSEKPNGISMILEPFCALFQRHAQRNTLAQPAPPPRRKFSARVAPPTPMNRYKRVEKLLVEKKIIGVKENAYGRLGPD